MIPVPDLPRWQQYLLLTGTLLAVTACVCLRLAGNGQGVSLLPLILPFLLWWPRPADMEQRLYWWLSVVCVFGMVLGLLVSAIPDLLS